MKKLIKQGAELAHALIDLLADELMETQEPERKKKTNGKRKKDSKNRSRSNNNTD